MGKKRKKKKEKEFGDFKRATEQPSNQRMEKWERIIMEAKSGGVPGSFAAATLCTCTHTRQNFFFIFIKKLRTIFLPICTNIFTAYCYGLHLYTN